MKRKLTAGILCLILVLMDVGSVGLKLYASAEELNQENSSTDINEYSDNNSNEEKAEDALLENDANKDEPEKNGKKGELEDETGENSEEIKDTSPDENSGEKGDSSLSENSDEETGASEVEDLNGGADSSENENLDEGTDLSEDKIPEEKINSSEDEKIGEGSEKEGVWDGMVADSYAGGAGTSSEPYLIATAAQLAKVAYDTNYAKTPVEKYYKLIEDIYLNDISNWDSWVFTAPVNNWIPIGNSSHPFQGQFDGDGHVIYGVYINKSEDYQGIFGYNNASKIINLGSEYSYIIGKNCVGGIVGYNNSDGNTTNNCYNTGFVSGTTYVGGIVGDGGAANPTSCYNVGEISGNSYVGGIAGKTMSATNCWNIGTVNGSSYVGGIFGIMDRRYGYFGGNVSKCFNAGAINGTTYIGGIAGYTQPYSGLYQSSTSIRNCYNIGSVTAEGDKAAGIVGYPYNTVVANCYNAGICNFGSDTESGAIINSGVSSETNGLYYLAGCCGKNYQNSWSQYVTEMSAGEMREDNFVGTLNNGGSIWLQDTEKYNFGYPILKGIDYEVYASYQMPSDLNMCCYITVLDMKTQQPIENVQVVAEDNVLVGHTDSTGTMFLSDLASIFFTEAPLTFLKSGYETVIWNYNNLEVDNFQNCPTNYVYMVSEEKGLSNCANIYIIDNDLGIPITDALVNGIAVDTNGYVTLSVAEGGEDKLITVTADGYNEYVSTKKLIPNGTYYISLNPTEGDFAIVYARAMIGDTIKDLLSDKIYLQHTGEDSFASSDKVMMQIEVKVRGDAESYALVQGGTIISNSTDGFFSIPLVPRNESNSLTTLSAQKNVAVKATDANGKTVTKRIGIYISPEGAGDVKEEDKSGSFSIGSKISVTLPDDIPFLGGGSVGYGLENPLPFELTVDRNGEVKIAINKSASESMEAFKEDYNKLSERVKNLSDAASVFGGTPQPFGAGYFSASVSAKGYGEGYINMNKPGTFEIKVDVILSGGGSGKYTQYFMAGPVPFYVSIEAGASISGEATLSVKCGNSHIQSEGGVGTISGKVYLTPKAGVGIENMISVGISGTGACNYTWKPKDDYTKVWLTAYLELEAECFGWELNLWKSPEASYTIYESPGANAASAQAFYDSMTARVYDSHAYTIMDRSYQKKGIEGTRTTFGIGINDESGNCVQSYVYPAADPKLVTAGNKFYLFWLQDIPGRSSENRAAVVYASSDDGASFTAPQQLVAESENQTLDNGVDVYVDNGKIYVCWQDASKSFSSGMSLNEVAQSQMISYAVIDASTGNVLSHETVTETAGCYLQPKIYVSNGQPQIAWIQNSMTSANGIWGADNQETLQKYDSATGVTETLSIGDGNEKIVSMDGAVGSSQAGVVYALDTDGDLQTISDRIIYYDTRLGSGGSRIALTSGAGMYNNPVSEGGSIYWYSDGNISYTTIGSNAVANIYEEERADIGSNFRVLSEGDQTEILWNAIAYETGKVALYGIHSSGNGQWTSPYVIEQTDSEMTGAVSGSLRNGIPYISYMHIQYMDDGSKCHSICVTQKKNVTDTVLNYAGYAYEELKPGQTLPITVELTNKGNTAIENVEMKIDGASIGTESVNLGAGETGTFVLNQYTVPEGISSYSEHTLTVAAVSEENMSDNDYAIGIGYTDIKVLCSQRLQDENTWLDISVLNDSDIASDVTLNIRADKEDGEVLYTEELGTIEGGKGVSMTVNLQKYEDSCCTYFVEAVSGTEDVIEGNNIVFVYTGFGTDIPGGELVSDPRFYTVTFQSNGGSEVESQQVEEDRSANEPPVPIREGYRFTGWYLNGEPYNFYHPVTGDITLEAMWEEYAALAAPSASFPSGSEVEIGTKIVLTCAASGAEIYYTLDGTAPDRLSTLYQEPISVVDDITITAIAVKEGYQDSPVMTFTYHVKESKPGTYLVVFQGNGGNTVENQEVEEGGKVAKPADPVKEGYRFTGWYLEDELYDFESPVTGNLRLEARWEEIAVLHMPVANIPSGKTVAEGSKIILSSDQAGVKIYYTLDGTVPTGSNLLYKNPIVINEDTVIKAIAVKNGYQDSPVATFSYTVSFTKDDLGDILPEDFPEGGVEAVPAGLWIAGVDENGYTYTGKAIKPEVRVYDYKTLLQPKKDYTISYKNNTKVNDGSISDRAPSVVVTGKGNYSGKETEIFRILAKDIAERDITAEDITTNYNKKIQKVVPTLLQNGRKLKNKKDYTVEYPDLVKDSDAYKAPGTYTILIRGTGGYGGEREVSLVITEAKLMSKVNVSKIAVQPYTGETITSATMSAAPVVKSGRAVLREGVHYTASYEDNVEVGTAVMILSGTGKETPEGTYTGKKKVTFKITGVDIKKAVVTGIPQSMVYTGSEITQDISTWGNRIRLTVNKDQQETKELTEGVDYTVEYQNNVTPGTARILFIGINGYSGTLKKSFKITAYDIQKDSEGLLNVAIEGQPVYAKGGSRPEPVVRFGDSILEKGRDYTLSYKNNTAVNDGMNVQKVPAVIVKGKGCFKGSRSLSYTIVKQNIEKLKIAAPDKVYQNKNNAYKSVPKVIDLDGKTLKVGKDYEKNYTYSYGEETRLEDGSVRSKGENIDKDDILPANTLVNITVTGTGNYSGTLEGQYRVVASDISKAKVTIPAQIYTGKEITLDKNQITVKIGKDILAPENYKIVTDSYKNNVRKGTANVSIKGVGNYGGTKNAKFKIKARSMLWWWRN